MLNEQQEAIVKINPNIRAVAVNAGPGSGKTHSMTYRVEFLLDHVDQKDLILVTLTVDAAKNMWNRLIKRIPALDGSDLKRRVCTIHALCYRIWCKHTRKRWDVLTDDTWEKRKLRDDALGEIIASVGFGKWFSRTTPENLLNWIDLSKREGLMGENASAFFVMHLGPADGGAVYEARVRWDQWLEDHNFITFADMFLNVDLMMRDPKNRENWGGRFVIVDEAQDTTEQAMRILTALSEGGQLWKVGDIAQALFDFAGAAPEKNLGPGFDARFPHGKRMNVRINYRSSKSIIETANTLVKNAFEE